MSYFVYLENLNQVPLSLLVPKVVRPRLASLANLPQRIRVAGDE